MAKPRLLHPLMGSDIHTLLVLLIKNRPGHYPFHLLVLLATALLRWPFSTYERWQVSRQVLQDSPQKTAFKRQLLSSETSLQTPPIFIVGHWRSGTTFLYNVLSRSPQFAYVSPLATGLPWDFLTLGKWMQPLLNKALPQGRFIDQVAVNPDSPQEDEIALASMQPLSFYHGLYFPQRFIQHFNAGIFLEGCNQREVQRWEQIVSYFYRKLKLQNPGRQLLIKNPVYTARIAQLRKLWPNAKFIHIYRNPYRVFQSTERFYHKLFPEIALQPFEHVPVRETILSSYPRMMEALYKDVKTLSEEEFVELQFEAFESDPISQLQQIYAQLQLPDWEIAKPLFQKYLSEQKHYQKNQYPFSAESAAEVSRRWQGFISRWGYSPPENY